MRRTRAWAMQEMLRSKTCRDEAARAGAMGPQGTEATGRAGPQEFRQSHSGGLPSPSGIPLIRIALPAEVLE